MNALLVGGYIYLWIFLTTAGIFALALKFRQSPTIFTGPFDMVAVTYRVGKEGNEKESRMLSAGASAVILVVLLMITVTVLWLLSRMLKDWIAVVFIAIAAASIWEFISLFRVEERIGFFATRHRAARSAKLILAVGLGSLWFVFPSWVTYDLTFILIAYTVISTVGPTNVATLLAVSAGLVAFDVWGVFFSGFIVKVALESAVIPPMLLLVPANPFSWNFEYLTGIGLGDVFVSGAIIVTATKYGLTRYAVTGYAIGLFLTEIAVMVFQTSMPALTTLIPTLLGAMAIGYAIKKTKIRREGERK